MTSEQLKHLEFIQAVIARMAGNSFLLKGWSVTLSTAVIGFAVAKDSNLKFAVLALLPPALFLFLDAYYLHQERLFRGLHNRIRLMDEQEWKKNGLFSMDTKGVALEVKSWKRTLVAPVVFWPHFVVFLVVVCILGSWWCRLKNA